MSSSRRKQSPPPPNLAEVDFSDLEVIGGPAPNSGEDPALAAARLLISSALAAAGVSLEEAGHDGVICLIHVPLDWTEAIRDAWRAMARVGERYSDGARDGSWKVDYWTAWSPTEAPRTKADDGSHAVATATWRGRHILGVSSDLTWLPHDLLAAADHRLTLPGLTGADLVSIARGLCGGPVTDPAIPDAAAAALTPRVLRLARRPGQTADDYLRKVSDIIARDASSVAAAPQTVPLSPRAEPRLDRLHGMDEAVAWGMALAADLDGYREGKIPWSSVDGGCLLSGPPGTGKTLFAQALAATCRVPLVLGSYGAWLGSGSGHQGDLLRGMRKTFSDARDQAPSIVFLDEVDSFPNRAALRHAWADWEIQIVNALLAEIDGVGGRGGVVVVAACNNPDLLDPALVRAGRLDRHVRIRLPDTAALAMIIAEHLGGDLEGADLTTVSLAAAGSSGADGEQLVRGARRRARVAGRAVEMSDLAEEVCGGKAEPEGDRWTAAVHEAGHAVVACLLMPGSLEAVSLRGGATGGKAVIHPRSSYPTARDMQARMVMMLAGRAAEEVIIGRPSVGAGGGPDSDLAQATLAAAASITAFGFDGSAGLAWHGRPDLATLPDLLRDPLLASAVGAALDRAHAAALGLVGEHGEAVRAVAEALLSRLAMDGDEVAAIVGRASRGRAS